MLSDLLADVVESKGVITKFEHAATIFIILLPAQYSTLFLMRIVIIYLKNRKKRITLDSDHIHILTQFPLSSAYLDPHFTTNLPTLFK